MTNPDDRGPLITADPPLHTEDRTGRVFPWERRLLRTLLESLGRPPVSAVLWNGETVHAFPEEPVATICFRNRLALLRTFLDSDLQFGDAYTDGQIEVEGDLVQLLHKAFCRAGATVQPRRHRAWHNRNSVNGSRENIFHHYDVGNEFFKLWLDDRMLYTCAYFTDSTMSLEAAQVAKMDHVCRKLRLRPGEHIVEAGCGWGSLALHMAAKYGVTVRAFNISQEQIAHASARADQEGLASRVEFVQDDYRNITGAYDAFVAVGMLEHVGVRNYGLLGKIIDRCLTRSGRGLIHTIGLHTPMRFNRWLEARIFPGAEPPALSEVMQILEPRGFCVLDVENLRPHYALTLRHWLERFERASAKIETMFDDRFLRTWRLYLAGSLAAYTSGWMQLFQILFNRRACNDFPLTRAHLYESQESAQ